MTSRHSLTSHVTTLLRLELEEVSSSSVETSSILAEFSSCQHVPTRTDVVLHGGAIEQGWRVARVGDDYAVIYLPCFDCFSLCVESVFGPIDIAVHGSALECFSSV